MNNLEIRKKALLEIQEDFQKRYDQILDQLSILKGSKERIEKFIEELQTQIKTIEVEENGQ